MVVATAVAAAPPPKENIPAAAAGFVAASVVVLAVVGALAAPPNEKVDDGCLFGSLAGAVPKVFSVVAGFCGLGLLSVAVGLVVLPNEKAGAGA